MIKLALYALIIAVFIAGGICYAAEETKSLEAIEVLTGFGWGKLRATDNYNLYPITVGLDFNLKPLTQKINFNPKPLLQFQLAPYIATVSQPNTNVELGTSFFLKAGVLPQTSKIQPYIKVGVGLVYMTQHTREQATQFNFSEQGGVGMHYFFAKDWGLTIEGIYRHLSNASIKHPNQGINTCFGSVGVTYKF